MKRLLLALSLLTIGGLAYAGQGTSNTLTVSSGTFKPVQGSGNNSGNFVQWVGIADSSYTVTAPVDPVTGLEVQLATGTAVFGSIANTTFAATQSGVFQVEPGSNSFRASIQNTPAVTQSGVFQVEPGSNTFKAAIQNAVAVTKSGTWNALMVDVGTGTWPVSIVAGAGSGGTSSNFNAGFPSAGTSAGFINPSGFMQAARVDASSNTLVAQSGVWQVEPGSNSFRTSIQNTVTISGAVTQSGVFQVEPGSNSFRASIQNTPAVTQSGVFQVEPGTNTFKAAISNAPFGVNITTSIVNAQGTSIVIVSTFANVTASQTDSPLVSPVASTRLCVHALTFVTGGTATTSIFNSKPSGAGTALSMTFANGANSGISLAWSPIAYFCTASGEGLSVTTGAGSTTGIQILYGKE